MRHTSRTAALATLLLLAATACTDASAGGTDAPADGDAATGATAPADRSDSAVAVDPAAAGLLPAAVKQKGVLTVASDASYRPFEYFDTDNKTMIGFDIDITDALGAKLGLEVEHVNAGFDGILPGLSARKYDIGASAFSITPERAKSVDFVRYVDLGSAIAVKKGNPLKLRMEPMALCGRTVAAQKGSIQGLEQLPEISAACTKAGRAAVRTEMFPSQDGANLALVSGRVDASMADTAPLTLQAKASGGQFELAPGPEYKPVPAGLALAKGSELKAALDAAMKSLTADGTAGKLADKWGVPAQAAPENGS
ncbi:ABC transporter substrate-binding protein [Streptomyces sp. TE5632]